MDPRIARIAVLSTVALMVVGAVGTWASASNGIVEVSVSGTDGGRDGTFVIVCAAILAAAAIVASRPVRIIGVLAALAAAGICLYDVVDISGTEPLRVGWGLWVALAASVVGVLDAIMLIVASRRA